MNSLLLVTSLILGPVAGAPPSGDCPDDTAVRPGRWAVESVRPGEPPARGVADIVRWDGGCVLLERLLLHFDDGSSHHLIFVQGTGAVDGGPRLLQIGDHPLFLAWRPDGDGEAYRTERSTDRGPVELRWRVRSADDGFEKELSVRRDPAGEWTSSEVVRYTPLPAVSAPDDVPPRRPGPFHDPDACEDAEFRQMDYLLGHWFSEEWVRDGEGWSPETVSDVSVRPVIGGCALVEEHPIYDDGALTDRLLLFRGYDPSRGGWRQLVFGHGGDVREWDLERTGEGWLLTPVGGEMQGRIRIVERREPGGIRKTVRVRSEEGDWETRRLLRYVEW